MKKILSKMIAIFLSVLFLTSCESQLENITSENSTASTPIMTEETTEEITEETTVETTVLEVTTEAIQTTEVTDRKTLAEQYYFVSPENEKSVTKIFASKSIDGIEVEVTVHGYQSDISGFYIKSDTPVLFEIKFTNNSDKNFYQYHVTDSEFPFIYWDIENYYGGKLILKKQYGFQEANRLEKLEPGETRILQQYFVVKGSGDMLIGSINGLTGEPYPVTWFSGQEIISYGLFDQEITVRDYEIADVNERFFVFAIGFDLAYMGPN